jgi:hypothetical protein
MLVLVQRKYRPQSATGHREIDGGQAIVGISHLPVDFAAQTVVHRHVRVRARIVLAVHVCPSRAAVFVGAADADLRRAQVPGRKSANALPFHWPVNACAGCRVRIDRIERQVKQVATDFHSVRIAVEQQVVVQLAEQALPSAMRRSAIDTGPGFTPMRQPSIALKTRRRHVPLE